MLRHGTHIPSLLGMCPLNRGDSRLPDPALTRSELEEQADVEGDEKARLVRALWDWQNAARVESPYRAHELLEHVRSSAETGHVLR